jgi:ribosomal protein S18 acetylase RimI-like enzyme
MRSEHGMQQIGRFAVIVIRPASLSDAESLAALAEQTFREAFAADNSAENIDLHCAQYFSPRIQGEEISEPRLVTLLAECDGELTGFAQLRLEQSMTCIEGERPAELRRIYVANKWHGRGVARELMRAVYAAAADAGSDCLWLGVWEKNPRAIAFYRKCGFSVVGDHVFMLGQDRQRDLIMVAQPGVSEA